MFVFSTKEKDFLKGLKEPKITEWLTHASGSTFILFNSQNEAMRWDMSPSFHEIVKRGWGAQGHQTVHAESMQVVDPVGSPEGVFAKPDAES